MPAIINAVESYATLGEIVDSMKDVFPLTKDDEFSPNKKFT